MELDLADLDVVRCLRVKSVGAGQRGKDVGRAGGARGVRGQLFAARVKHAGAAHRRQDERQREPGAHHRGADIDFGNRDGATRTKRDRLERPHIRAKRRFRFGAAVEVVEHDAGRAPRGQASEIFDVQNVRCRH